MVPILLLIFGLVILIFGGEIFIRGSASLARKLNVSPIVIGLTVVAFGTSVAELVVNILAAFKGSSDLAVGNILGSNIANVLLILGVAAIIRNLKIKKGTAWKELPLCILSVIILFILGNDVLFNGGATINILTSGDGLILLGFFLIFLYYTYGLTKVEGEKEDIKVYSWFYSILFILVGLAGIMGGAKLMVDNGIKIAEIFGLSQLFIGVTVVAIGTSLPELVTSIIAAYHGHDDLVIGNIVGSNIFNVLWILGLTPIISPIRMNTQANVDILIAILSVLLLFVFMFIGHKHQRYQLRRWQGVVFLLFYSAYIFYVFYRG
ncbi:MAG: sodium:proton exchanger [Candidatus Magasanikbacteria bacterium CG10_big_fil_rev_8_21_14_0_10_40_10]|uniref:Sodium:proton exchanger n=1 Tax=Candidatus Magasanikbacteria bacterium CG10_big_fil_rev_8_21_14_0_10_40_10 TaxID=1974648 RepID=A0A2M6W3P9_9BACT|nr:MAG: sodium:proton exchanger [Candidatus Magasanikbacteria bacterium CG10_big_fil_rev_8_21_14_0_10_40_10]